MMVYNSFCICISIFRRSHGSNVLISPGKIVIIRKTKGISDWSDAHISVAEQEICSFYFLREDILLQTYSWCLSEITGKIFFIVAKMRSDTWYLQIITYKIVYVINNIIIKLFLKRNIGGICIFFFQWEKLCAGWKFRW